MSEKMVEISVSDLELIANGVGRLHGDFQILSRFANDVIENTCDDDLDADTSLSLSHINMIRKEGGKDISILEDFIGEILGGDRKQRELVEDMIATDTDIPISTDDDDDDIPF